MGYVMTTDTVRAARSELDAAREAEHVFRVAVRKRAEAAWDAGPGCQRCKGRGWVVTWDTLDSLSGCYAEYGGCPAEGCTPETREASGLRPAPLLHDRWHFGVKVPDPMDSLTPDEAREFSALQGRLKAAEAAVVSAEAGSVVSRGAHVRVVKGRKVPRGTEGEVIWTGKDRYRGLPRIGLKDRKDKVHWTALANCELICMAENS